ncbi:Retrovirus-related Pol polyprotein from transposon [Apostichopus japonicus]|uniref:Retrovirus-related Pol polyprotein from transposon n=2 Tax=Stichopus japonicus TaxID=307972 RepID=A0A2G8K0L5_STIJA|nr:Retrovirus-related Pol polyprotein from transposon [Apostichopus japonicus]
MVLGRISEGPRHWEAALVEPTEKFVEKHCLLVAKGLVDPRKSKIPLRVFNPTSDVKRVYGGTCIASLEETANLDVSFPETERQQQKVSAVSTKRCEQGEVPQHVTGLLEAEDGYMNDEQRALLKELVTDYADVFARSSADLGYTTVAQHKIDTDNARPVKQPARRVPVQQREVERELLQQMLDAGVVEPSSSPWASPIVLVKKKNGSTRFCVDYRRLNTLTVKDSYPIPRIADSLDAMAGSRWFSTLDLASGYWQVGMAAEDRQKTAFITGNGLYQFRVMPFGLCNAPATFERLMDRVLSGLHWEACLVYLDDVIVYGATFSEAMDRLKTVFNRFRDAGLKLSPGKCQLFKQSVTYLGHIVSKDGVGTDPEKVKAVKEWPRPQNLSEVRSFVGLCGYYRRFIRGFAQIALPLFKLTEKKQKFDWNQDCETAFSGLKTALTTAPVLSYPMSSGQDFILDTDASDFATGSVLSQIQDGNEKPIAYFSKTMSKQERRYCITRKELLAVVQSVKHFHHYLYGTRFLIRTDHAALKWLMSFKHPEGQTARWLEILGTYTFEISHRPGRFHGNADGLSRRPCSDDCQHCTRTETGDIDRDGPMEFKTHKWKRKKIQINVMAATEVTGPWTGKPRKQNKSLQFLQVQNHPGLGYRNGPIKN